MIIQGLWIGDKLTQFEYNSINSWLKNGFIYHLYTYYPVANIPVGVIVKDARDILPETEIFKYSNALTPFSDYFRFKLLYERGNAWTDCDIYSINAFDTLEPYIFIGERTIKQGAFKSIKPIKPINSFIYVKEKKDKFILEMLEGCIKYKNQYLKEGGPLSNKKNEGLNAMHWKGGIKYFNKMIIKHNLEQYIKPYKFAFPIDWWNYQHIFKNGEACIAGRGWTDTTDLSDNIFLDNDIKMITIHNGWIKNKKINKEQIFNDCFIARLFKFISN